MFLFSSIFGESCRFRRPGVFFVFLSVPEHSENFHGRYRTSLHLPVNSLHHTRDSSSWPFLRKVVSIAGMLHHEQGRLKLCHILYAVDMVLCRNTCVESSGHRFLLPRQHEQWVIFCMFFVRRTFVFPTFGCFSPVVLFLRCFLCERLWRLWGGVNEGTLDGVDEVEGLQRITCRAERFRGAAPLVELGGFFFRSEGGW